MEEATGDNGHEPESGYHFQRAVLDALNDGVFVVSVDCNSIVEVNRSACEQFRYIREQMLDKNPGGFGQFPSTQESMTEWLELARDEGPQRFEWLARASDGHVFWTEIDARLFLIGDRALYLLSLRDIEDRKKAERERAVREIKLRHEQKLSGIGTLANGVAHEINNPLTTIINYARLIIEKSDAEGDERATFAEQIVHEGERIAGVVRNLQLFSRPEQATSLPERIGDIIDSVLVLVRKNYEKEGIAITVDLAENLPAVLCCAPQIRQVLFNLVSNAREAMTDGPREIMLRAFLSGDDASPTVRVEVADTGCGISTALQPRIFEPFFTTKPGNKSAGLGLHIAFGIIRDHGGLLSFSSQPGEKTRFWFDLAVSGRVNSR